MAKRMLIDATHPEETRVAVVDGRRLEEFDVEVANKKLLKGNIYLAKITRVEPSLQAAFVEYGGNRHGFLAFSEIHPDYYRIPIEDRQALLAEQAALAREQDAEQEEDPIPAAEESGVAAAGSEAAIGLAEASEPPPAAEHTDEIPPDGPPSAATPLRVAAEAQNRLESDGVEPPPLPEEAEPDRLEDQGSPAGRDMPKEQEDLASVAEDAPVRQPVIEEAPALPQPLETIGGDEAEEAPQRRPRTISRRYKIQDVIKRRQILLVQVTKEERGNKGAALTTYLSLAGRYCVLMPNTDRGGGVSRKITNVGDRKRLKSIIDELQLPPGMAVIVRTAGSERSKPEVKRDFEYLLRLWDDIRNLTLRSTAPALIYEEANLIKRAIRDLYTRDIEDIQVEGDDAYRAAKSFMRMLMPSHAKRVQQYKDPMMPLFTRYQIESQLDAIHNPVVQLKSGGYIVINQTEALVAIDVNSGRATRERNIEETALKTNLEAADEIARQLRLRDLAGLIVIDFIDMDESRHNAQVERRLKEAMRNDRARIQLGRISPFGLLELSRQRLRPSLFEASTELCRYCRGTGHVRSTESTALHVLRSIEEEGSRQKSAAITVSVPTQVALFILNHKRQSLAELEARQGFRIYLGDDDSLVPPEFRIERLKALAPGDLPPAPIVQPSAPAEDASSEETQQALETAEEAVEATDEQTEDRPEDAGTERRRGRRRRRRGRDRDRDRQIEPPAASGPVAAVEAVQEPDRPAAQEVVVRTESQEASATDGSEPARRRRRRGRRGGRRRRRAGQTTPADQSNAQDQESASSQANGSDESMLARAETDVSEPLQGAPQGLPAPVPEQSALEIMQRDSTESQPRSAIEAHEPEPSSEPVEAASHAAAAQQEPRKRGWWRRF